MEVVHSQVQIKPLLLLGCNRTAHFACLPYLTHLTEIISSLVHVNVSPCVPMCILSTLFALNRIEMTNIAYNLGWIVCTLGGRLSLSLSLSLSLLISWGSQSGVLNNENMQNVQSRDPPGLDLRTTALLHTYVLKSWSDSSTSSKCFIAKSFTVIDEGFVVSTEETKLNVA